MTHLPPNSIPPGQAPCALLSHLPPPPPASSTITTQSSSAAEENKDRKLLDLFIGSLPPTTPTYYSITTLLYLVVLGQGPSVDGTILLGVVL